METEMNVEPGRRDSDTRRRSGAGDGNVAGAVANLPINLGVTAGDGGRAYDELETPTEKGDAQSLRLPHLRDYNFYVSWGVFVITFLVSAVRQGFCNYMTGSGIAAEDDVVMQAVIKAISTPGVIFGGLLIAQAVIGDRYRNPLLLIFTPWATMCYAVAFAITPTIAALTVFPNVLLLVAVGMLWSRRRCFAIIYVVILAIVQILLTFIINALPLVQAQLPEAAQQFLVPALKTAYVGFTSEVLTTLWKKMYRRPCSPYALTGILLITLVSAETMGVVGLLAAVDSANPWSNAAIFCATTVVMETNSRSGIFMSLVFRLMGKTYRFSDAAHIFRWAKMWASYCWISAFVGFAVPALALGLRVKDSNFTMVNWEVWALVGIYVLQQIITDFVYVYVQHYIRPSAHLSQTAARCLVLGEATPFFGENEHIAEGGLQSPKSPKDEEFEPVTLKLGPWTIKFEALMSFLLFEYTVNIWNNYVRGQFCIYGTFLPSENGNCD